MNCAEFRRHLAADPMRVDAACQGHLDVCAECVQLVQRAQLAEQRLAGVLAVDLPAGFEQRLLRAVRAAVAHYEPAAAPEPSHKPRSRRHWLPALAVAAMLVLAFVASVGVWRYQDSHSLEAYAVTHMLGKEFVVMQLDKPVGEQAVAAVFASRNTSLRGPVPADVTYAHDCRLGPSLRAVHLVMRMDTEPVAVLYVPSRRGTRKDFKRDGWYGREVPTEHGTMILLASSAAPFDAVQLDWQMAIDGGAATTAGAP